MMDYCRSQNPKFGNVICLLLKGHSGWHMAPDTSNPPSNGWHEWPNDAPLPALGVSVSDGIATDTVFG